MSLSAEQRADVAQRLELVCAEMHVLGKTSWSMRGEFLDKWIELSEERKELEGLLGCDETSS